MKTCKLDGCAGKHRSKGYCSMHYERWRTTGDPGPVERILSPANLTCSTDGCDRPAKTRGVCQIHARRASREQQVARGEASRVHAWATLEERLNAVGWIVATRRPELGPCWEWAGVLDRKGYGRINIGKQKTGAAHRVAYQVWKNDGGPVDPSRYVCHKCDNPPCINPAHLFLGDQFANMGDSKTKRRNANGMRQGGAKLTDAQVAEIRAKYVPRKYSHARLGDEYGVTAAAIGALLRGRNWKTPTNPRP